jgi:hypothetical protein
VSDEHETSVEDGSGLLDVGDERSADSVTQFDDFEVSAGE